MLTSLSHLGNVGEAVYWYAFVTNGLCIYHLHQDVVENVGCGVLRSLSVVFGEKCKKIGCLIV